MAHLDPNTIQSFQHDLQLDPNQSFRAVFQWFLNIYGVSNKIERQENKARMEAKWNPSDGVEILINQRPPVGSPYCVFSPGLLSGTIVLLIVVHRLRRILSVIQE